jgi:hypothetical protein
MYEQLLNRDRSWAFRKGSMHFEKESAVHKTLRVVTQRLDELGVSYALAGAMAMFFHGLRRFTEYVDLLVSRDGLTKLQHALIGRGYGPRLRGAATYGKQVLVCELNSS